MNMAELQQIDISIITPAFNRAYELKYMLKSVAKQKISHDLFELIIVDDGSADNTKGLIDNFKKEVSFSVVYIYQQNL